MKNRPDPEGSERFCWRAREDLNLWPSAPELPQRRKKGVNPGQEKCQKVPILKEKQAIRSKSETSGKKVEKGPVVSKANIFKSSLPPILTGCWMFDFCQE